MYPFIKSGFLQFAGRAVVKKAIFFVAVYFNYRFPTNLSGRACNLSEAEERLDFRRKLPPRFFIDPFHGSEKKFPRKSSGPPSLMVAPHAIFGDSDQRDFLPFRPISLKSEERPSP